MNFTFLQAANNAGAQILNIKNTSTALNSVNTNNITSISNNYLNSNPKEPKQEAFDDSKNMSNSNDMKIEINFCHETFINVDKKEKDNTYIMDIDCINNKPNENEAANKNINNSKNNKLAAAAKKNTQKAEGGNNKKNKKAKVNKNNEDKMDIEHEENFDSGKNNEAKLVKKSKNKKTIKKYNDKTEPEQDTECIKNNTDNVQGIIL